MKWISSIEQKRAHPVGHNSRMALGAADIITSWRIMRRRNGNAADALNLLYIGTSLLVVCISGVETA